MTADETARIPAADGLRLVPDWAAHRRLWVAWPDDRRTWGDHLGGAQEAAVTLARAAAAHQPVSMLTNSRELASVSLSCGGGIAAMPYAESAVWMRAAGPALLSDGRGRRGAVVWQWRSGDSRPALGRALGESLGLEIFEAPLVMERGALDVDDTGTGLALEGPMLAANPGYDRGGLEAALHDWLGVRKVIWLDGALAGTGNAARTVDVARFAGPGVVYAVSDDDPRDENHAALKANCERLEGARDAGGRRLRVVQVPQPRPVRMNSRRLPLSYLNFARVAEAVIMPAFEDRRRDQAAHDRIVEGALESMVEQIPALELAHGDGGLHCLTLSEPG